MIAKRVARYYTDHIMIEKQSTQLNQLQRLIDEVDRVATESGAPAPGEFLARVMAGEDPRPLDSPLYTLVKRIAFREFSGQGESFPTPEEWSTVVCMVLDSDEYQRARVTMDQSIKAGERLMEYLHAKMRSIEVQGNLGIKLEVKPLTGEDLDAFKERFNDEF
jgi:hypothetical protein